MVFIYTHTSHICVYGQAISAFYMSLPPLSVGSPRGNDGITLTDTAEYSGGIYARLGGEWWLG